MNYPICIKLCHCARGVPEAVAQLQPAWLLHQSITVPLCHIYIPPIGNFLLKKKGGYIFLVSGTACFFTKNSLKSNSLDHFVLCQGVLAQLVFEAEVGAFRTYIASHTTSIISPISTLFTFSTLSIPTTTNTISSFSPFSHFSIFRHSSTFSYFSHFSTPREAGGASEDAQTNSIDKAFLPRQRQEKCFGIYSTTEEVII